MQARWRSYLCWTARILVSFLYFSCRNVYLALVSILDAINCSFEFPDTRKMPLGKISKVQISKGLEVLIDLEEALKNKVFSGAIQFNSQFSCKKIFY